MDLTYDTLFDAEMMAMLSPFFEDNPSILSSGDSDPYSDGLAVDGTDGEPYKNLPITGCGDPMISGVNPIQPDDRDGASIVHFNHNTPIPVEQLSLYDMDFPMDASINAMEHVMERRSSIPADVLQDYNELCTSPLTDDNPNYSVGFPFNQGSVAAYDDGDPARNAVGHKDVGSDIWIPNHEFSIATEYVSSEPIEEHVRKTKSVSVELGMDDVDQKLKLSTASRVIVKKKKSGIQVTVGPGKDTIRLIYVPCNSNDSPEIKLASATVGAAKARRFRNNHGDNRERITANVKVLESYARLVFPSFSTEACLDQAQINLFASMVLCNSTKTGAAKSAERTRERRKQKDQQLVKMCQELVEFFHDQLVNGHKFPGDVFDIITSTLKIKI